MAGSLQARAEEDDFEYGGNPTRGCTPSCVKRKGLARNEYWTLFKDLLLEVYFVREKYPRAREQFPP